MRNGDEMWVIGADVPLHLHREADAVEAMMYETGANHVCRSDTGMLKAYCEECTPEYVFEVMDGLRDAFPHVSWWLHRYGPVGDYLTYEPKIAAGVSA